MNPDEICLLPSLFLTSNFLKLSRFMGAMSIERIETCVESYSSNVPVSENVVIY